MGLGGAAMLRAGMARLLRREAVRRLLRRIVGFTHGLHEESDGWALVVEARGKAGTARFTLTRRAVQAEATAVATAVLASMLADEVISQPGVWFAEQVVVAERFFAGLTGRRAKRFRRVAAGGALAHTAAACALP